MTAIQAEYHSIWDQSVEVESRCSVNSVSGLLEIECSDDDELVHDVCQLDREYVQLSSSSVEHEVVETDGEYFVSDLAAFLAEAQASI